MYAIVIAFDESWITPEALKKFCHGTSNFQSIEILYNQTKLHRVKIDGKMKSVVFTAPSASVNWFWSFSPMQSLFESIEDKADIANTIERTRRMFIGTPVQQVVGKEYTIEVIEIDIDVKTKALTPIFEQEILYSVLSKLTVEECKILGIENIKLQQEIHSTVKK